MEPTHAPDPADGPDPAGFVLPSTPGRRTRRQVALLGGALAMAVAAAGGAFAIGAQLPGGGGGAQPDDVLRSGAIALAKVDLNPSLHQKLAVWQLSQKFPAAFNPSSKDTVLSESVINALLRGTPLSYAADVKPWLGDRAAIAVYPAPAKGADPELAFALQYTDATAMTAGLQKLDRSRHISWATRDGYVVVAEQPEQAAAVLAADGAHAMSAQGDYRSDIAALGGSQLALGWADVAGLGATETAAIAHAAGGSTADLLQSALVGQAVPSSGRIVVGLHAESSYLEVVGRVLGAKPGGVAHSAGHDLAGAMPADSLATISMTDMGAASGRISDLLGSEPAVGSAVKGLDKRYGLNVSGLLGAIFGKETAVALGPVHGKNPAVTLRTTGGNAKQVTSILGLLTAMAGDKFAKLQPTADGFVIGNNAGEVQAAAGGGHPLADTAAFSAAVPDADGAGLVAYANIAELIAQGVISPAQANGLQHVQAIGLTSSGGDAPQFRLRLTVN
jgi:Protein of unknown function (DUF3352)